MHMCICEFCNNPFCPRPQVKNPRACQNKKCQRARQKANVNEWRTRNPGLYDKIYHKAKRDNRKKLIETTVNDIIECLKIGSTFLYCTVNEKLFASFLIRFFQNLGIKAVKKLWNVKKTC